MFAMLVSGFGMIAAMLAAIGLYALMAWSAARRTSEIGIRIALGARAYNVHWLIVRQSLALVAIGIVLGVPLCVALSKFVGSLLYGVTPIDPWSFAGGITAMATIVASHVPRTLDP